MRPTHFSLTIYVARAFPVLPAMKSNLAETQDLLVFCLVLLYIHLGHLAAHFAFIGLITALKYERTEI